MDTPSDEGDRLVIDEREEEEEEDEEEMSGVMEDIEEEEEEMSGLMEDIEEDEERNGLMEDIEEDEERNGMMEDIEEDEERNGIMEDIEEDEERNGIMEDIEEEEEERRGIMEDIEDIEEEDEEVDVVGNDEEEKKDEDNERGLGSRMILRPHTETKPCGSSSLPSSDDLCLLPSTSSSSSLMNPSGGNLPSSSMTTSGMHKRMQWSIGDMLMFYEAVKQYGKEFDALHRVMAKRKLEINKEQLRNFFFNFNKQVRDSAEIKDEDWPVEMSRDARELFTVINGCEWKKRMGSSYKFEPLKLKALIMEGTATIKIRCKKQHITLKTPCCPALLQFFSFNRRITRFPPDIVLYLSPKRYQDGTNVMSRGHSRNLCIRLNTCDRVERIFELLHFKWKSEEVGDEDEDEEEGEDGGGNGEEKDGRPFTVRLFPSKHTLMGEITFMPSTSSFGNVSVNMLQEDRAKAETIKRQFKRGRRNMGDVCYKASQSLIPHLTLNRAVLLAGLTREAAGSASIAELYTVCGLSREIVLLYSIEEEIQDGDDEPWDILSAFIARGYGEATAEKRPAGVNRTLSRASMDYEESLPKRMRLLKELKHPAATSFIMQSPIVTKEMNEFQDQLRSLSSRPRANRRSPVPRKRIPLVSKKPLLPPSASFSSAHRRTTSFSTFPSTPSRTAASAASTPGSTTMSSMARSTTRTTFPQMSSGGRTPSEKRETMDPMEEALKAALTSPGNTLDGVPSTSQALRRVPAAAFTSPNKTMSGTLPSDVRSSMEQMMAQNSVDYCMEFAQLVNCTTITIDSSPSKLSSL